MGFIGYLTDLVDALGLSENGVATLFCGHQRIGTIVIPSGN